MVNGRSIRYEWHLRISDPRLVVRQIRVNQGGAACMLYNPLTPSLTSTPYCIVTSYDPTEHWTACFIDWNATPNRIDLAYFW